MSDPTDSPPDTLTLEQFLGALALSGVERRTVANFEGAYCTLAVLDFARTQNLTAFVQTHAQWEENFGAWVDLMEALAQRIGK